MRRRAKSRAWVRRQTQDAYVRKAAAEGYRSRAAYKLLEIDAKHRLLRPGMAVLELGAAPGGWTQVAAGAVGAGGRVVAVDRLGMEPIPGVRVIRADLLSPGSAERIAREAGLGAFDLVLSDAAPNITGIAEVDDENFAVLVAAIAGVHAAALKPGGCALTKMFQGTALREASARQRRQFRKVAVARPGAIKKASREVYLIAQHKLTTPSEPDR